MSATAARELAVLSMIAAHPLHGYDIAAAFEAGPFQLLGLKKSAVYAILGRFDKRGWTVEKVAPQEGYPDRKICHITPEGRDALPGLMQNAGNLPQVPLMTLTMLHDSGVDVAALAQTELAKRQALRAQIAQAAETHGARATSDLGGAIVQAEIDVLARILST